MMFGEFTVTITLFFIALGALSCEIAATLLHNNSTFPETLKTLHSDLQHFAPECEALPAEENQEATGGKIRRLLRLQFECSK